MLYVEEHCHEDNPKIDFLFMPCTPVGRSAGSCQRTGCPLHSGLDQPQHLPDLAQSFHLIWPAPDPPPNWQGGVSYQIRVVYSNVLYEGGLDIDGATLFAFDGGGEIVD